MIDCITVFGGTGFIGRHLVALLLQKGGGPQVYSFKVLLELLLTALNRRRVLIPIPFALAEMQAGLVELLPYPPLTRDQVRLLKTDKVVNGIEPTLGNLGVQPRPLEDFLAAFKAKYR
jgi:NADH dehydrogenase